MPNLSPISGGIVCLTGLAGLSAFVAKADPEIAANAMLCAVNQASYLLRRQIESQSRDFLEHGGFSERMYSARLKRESRTSRTGPTSQTFQNARCAARICANARLNRGRMRDSPSGAAQAILIVGARGQYLTGQTSQTSQTSPTSPTSQTSPTSPTSQASQASQTSQTSQTIMHLQ